MESHIDFYACIHFEAHEGSIIARKKNKKKKHTNTNKQIRTNFDRIILIRDLRHAHTIFL